MNEDIKCPRCNRYNTEWQSTEYFEDLNVSKNYICMNYDCDCDFSIWYELKQTSININ